MKNIYIKGVVALKQLLVDGVVYDHFYFLVETYDT